MGEIIERKLDEYEKNAIFEMKSHYYICDVSENISMQNLDKYKMELGFTPEWIYLDDIIKLNEQSIKEGSSNDWTFREILVLKHLK